MIIFRYWLMNGRTLDEVGNDTAQSLADDLDSLRDYLAASLCPPVAKPREAWVIPAFHITDRRGNRHVIMSHSLVEVEIVVEEDLEVPPSHYQVEVHSGDGERTAQASRDMRQSWSTVPAPEITGDPEPISKPPFPPADGDVIGYYRAYGNPNR